MGWPSGCTDLNIFALFVHSRATQRFALLAILCYFDVCCADFATLPEFFILHAFQEYLLGATMLFIAVWCTGCGEGWAMSGSVSQVAPSPTWGRNLAMAVPSKSNQSDMYVCCCWKVVWVGGSRLRGLVGQPHPSNCSYTLNPKFQRLPNHNWFSWADTEQFLLACDPNGTYSTLLMKQHYNTLNSPGIPNEPDRLCDKMVKDTFRKLFKK